MTEQHSVYIVELVCTKYDTDLRGKVRGWVACVRRESATSNDYMERVVTGKTRRQTLRRAYKLMLKWRNNEI